MLPAHHRLRRSPDFREAVRRGRRAGGGHVVVHLLDVGAAPATGPDGLPREPVPVTAGLVVSRAVGGAVVRTRVKRRLRHLLAARVGELAPGARLVVRAAPSAAGATSAELAADLDRALASARRPPRGRAPRRASAGAS